VQEKHAREKRFSIGYFKREYLDWSPIAVVRRQERIIAFASLMPDYGRNHELSIDLMRHDPDMPPGTMDFLFLKLIEYARTAGYAYFSLGPTPFSAVGDSPWPRRDERLIRFFYEYGSEIYGAKGLRQYKEKFNPIWRGCYLAYQHGRAVHPLLVDLTALVAGGYRQILLRPKNP
jgi:phosphatidylglycerol lysyltransferase